jgi:hypothetical protein
MALITATELDQFRQTPPSAADLVTACIGAAEAWMIGRLGYDPAATTYTGAYYMGNGTPLLRLTGRPITAVTSLTMDSETLTVLAQGGTDSGQPVLIPAHGKWLRYRGGLFTNGSTIKITYAAGYATIPAGLKLATCILTWIVLEERNRVGMAGKSIGPEQINQLARQSSDYGFVEATIDQYANFA